MGKTPASIKEVVEVAARKHPEAETAVEDAMPRVRKCPEYSELVDDLVRSAIRHMIHDVRHNDNVKRKNLNKEYDVPRKVTGVSETVNAINRSLYHHAIGGNILGMLKGNELHAIGLAELGRSKGHKFNFHLCMKLERIVPGEKLVQDSVSERKLKAIFDECEKLADGV